MGEWLRDLLGGPGFMPHGHCYLWEPGLVWLQVLSNGAIGVAYVAIAAMLVELVRRGRDLPFKGIALAFGVFIISCGITHLFDVVVIWHPYYWADGVLRAITAAASVGTAILLAPRISQALALARGATAAQQRGMKLEAMVNDLETLYEQTRELEQLKTQFFANVSHELRTPLTLILGPTERLLGADNLSSEQRRDLEVVARNGRALLKHVNDLLDVSRLESGKMTMTYQRVDLTRMIARVAGLFEGLAADRALELTIDAPQPVTVEVDGGKVERVLLNLLGNAFKFTPDGGRIRVSLHQEGERVRLEVADSGPGVPASQREVVFDRFRQVEAEATRRQGGTGLGLTICRDFVRLHGGRIELGDAPEGGASFRVELPRQAPSGAAVSAGEAQEAAPSPEQQAALDELRQAVAASDAAAGRDGDRPRGLVVEDNRELNRFVAEVLGERYEVEQAFDGEQGLAAAERRPPDLVLSDIMMPRMSGDELVRALRQRAAFDAVPVVLLTAKADDELRLQLLREGAQDYLMKPFVAEELQARVANLITVKRARDLLQEELDQSVSDLEVLAREVTQHKRELETALASVRVAREHAERASQLKSQFLSLVSHELRTPLAALQLQLHRLQRGAGGALPAGKVDVVKRMTGSAARLHDLIESLLQYVRVEAGRLTVEAEPVDAGALCVEAVEELRPQAEGKGLALVCTAPQDMPPLVTDPRLLRLVVVNLLGNAIKFTQEGEVRLELSRTGDRHVFRVADTGPGIPAEERVRVFEAWEQLEPTRVKHTPGVGLGLALVREMVQALGGDVELESEVGRGSVFTVRLPDARAPEGGS